MKKETIQKTLFGENILTSYEDTTAWGETIIIPNFQPVEFDENDRLDHKKQYSITIHCNTIEEQEVIYDILKDKGLKCTKN